MKVLSYSLFGDPNSFEFNFYLRGIYFNARMNQILYPDFINVVHYQMDLYNTKVGELLEGLTYITKTNLVGVAKAPRCEAMLWRMMPLFSKTAQYTHVICRDADSVSTYREACCTYEWLDSSLPYHAINDNNAHGGLMGGLVAFNVNAFKNHTGYTSFEQMIKGVPLDKHGSDQNWMNKELLPKITEGLLFHKLQGSGGPAALTRYDVPSRKQVNPKLWVTDLISRYIGSAGVIDFELLRFLRAQPNQKQFDAFEKKYPQIFYWVK
jgi:hypothetical protein